MVSINSLPLSVRSVVMEFLNHLLSDQLNCSIEFVTKRLNKTLYVLRIHKLLRI